MLGFSRMLLIFDPVDTIQSNGFDHLSKSPKGERFSEKWKRREGDWKALRSEVDVEIRDLAGKRKSIDIDREDWVGRKGGMGWKVLERERELKSNITPARSPKSTQKTISSSLSSSPLFLLFPVQIFSLFPLITIVDPFAPVAAFVEEKENVRNRSPVTKRWKGEEVRGSVNMEEEMNGEKNLCLGWERRIKRREGGGQT